ncbi:isochorismatase family protein [Leuconostoc gelidum subsp. aenigmaticum]|uniref:isochorismatase family protein n=1 Tax=Leuconostoc gelidum TaxID=1244 RepID=UPI001CC5971C|nr:isochorismatase family protein [Leuconostoc gelidum]MBZ6004165.1 isochorismatase family protein [Leuconostoc gelidum subsp. aenigmaticum]MBZ6014717.1 isochorismatase family protein [Leuconostoc gelidum subsp. gelidum]
MFPTTEALLVVDLQNDVCKEPKDIFHLQKCVNEINNRILAYRETDQLLIFIQHNDKKLAYGSLLWEIISEINTQPNDYFIQKTHAHSFYHTDLSKIL